MSTDRHADTDVAAGKPFSTQDADELARLFESWQKVAEDESLPALTPLASRLLELTEDPSAATHELTQIVQSDAVLTGRILGLANSVALKGSGKPIFEVVGAVIRLGVDAVFEASFAQVAAQWLRRSTQLPDKARLHQLWLEYLITAFCSRDIANRLESEEVKASVAYAAGLLHDVGTLALCCARPAQMARFVEARYCIGTPLYEQFIEAHTQLGATLLRHWNTPAELAEVAGRHHQGFAPEESAATGVVFLADHLHEHVLNHERAQFHRSDKTPLGCFGGETKETSAALVALGLDQDLEDIVERVAGESARIEVLAAAVAV